MDDDKSTLAELIALYPDWRNRLEYFVDISLDQSTQRALDYNKITDILAIIGDQTDEISKLSTMIDELNDKDVSAELFSLRVQDSMMHKVVCQHCGRVTVGHVPGEFAAHNSTDRTVLNSLPAHSITALYNAGSTEVLDADADSD